MTNEKEGEILLYILQRNEDEVFSFSVVNSHPRVPYHLSSYRCDSSWFGQLADGEKKEKEKEKEKGGERKRGGEKKGKTTEKEIKKDERNKENGHEIQNVGDKTKKGEKEGEEKKRERERERERRSPSEGGEWMFEGAPSEKRQFVMELKDISAQRVKDSAFWFLLYRPLLFLNPPLPGGKGFSCFFSFLFFSFLFCFVFVFQKKCTNNFVERKSFHFLFFFFNLSQQPFFLFCCKGGGQRSASEFLYEVLFPSLNSLPLITNLTTPSPSIRWLRPPIFGDRTSIHCAWESLYVCFSRLLSPAHARFILFLMHWEQARSLLCDVTTTPKDDVSHSDLKVVSLALRRLAILGTEEAVKDDSLISVDLVSIFFFIFFFFFCLRFLCLIFFSILYWVFIFFFGLCGEREFSSFCTFLLIFAKSLIDDAILLFISLF